MNHDAPAYGLWGLAFTGGLAPTLAPEQRSSTCPARVLVPRPISANPLSPVQ